MCDTVPPIRRPTGMVGSPSEAKKCRCEVGDGVHGVFLLDLLVERLLVDAGLGGF